MSVLPHPSADHPRSDAERRRATQSDAERRGATRNDTHQRAPLRGPHPAIRPSRPTLSSLYRPHTSNRHKDVANAAQTPLKRRSTRRNAHLDPTGKRREKTHQSGANTAQSQRPMAPQDAPACCQSTLGAKAVPHHVQRASSCSAKAAVVAVMPFFVCGSQFGDGTDFVGVTTRGWGPGLPPNTIGSRTAPKVHISPALAQIWPGSRVGRPSVSLCPV